MVPFDISGQQFHFLGFRSTIWGNIFFYKFLGGAFYCNTHKKCAGKIGTALEWNRNGLQLTLEFLSNQVTFGVDGEICDKSIFHLFDIL